MSNDLLTVVILSWKRRENIPVLCSALRIQDIPVKIIVWSNEFIPNNDWDCDHIFYSSLNMICWPRWYICAQMESRYVMVIDDDICPNNTTAISHLIKIAEENYNKDIIVGVEGVEVFPGSSYYPASRQQRSRHTPDGINSHSIHYNSMNNSICNNTFVDIVKGRLMLMKPSVLSDLIMHPAYCKWGDDIVVSAHVGKKRNKPHIIPALPLDFFIDLDGKYSEMALTIRKDVRENREQCKKYYFG